MVQHKNTAHFRSFASWFSVLDFNKIVDDMNIPATYV